MQAECSSQASVCAHDAPGGDPDFDDFFMHFRHGKTSAWCVASQLANRIVEGACCKSRTNPLLSSSNIKTGVHYHGHADVIDAADADAAKTHHQDADGSRRGR